MDALKTSETSAIGHVLEGKLALLQQSSLCLEGINLGARMILDNNMTPTFFFRNGRPQPDNREGRETCLGVLKDVYRDGTVFHDISCHHKKPVICEQ